MIFASVGVRSNAGCVCRVAQWASDTNLSIGDAIMSDVALSVLRGSLLQDLLVSRLASH